jgi:competence protein ComEC
VLDVGQGLSVIVQTRHRALLYDTGPAFRLSDAGQAIVVPALREAGVRRLDALVVSHDDQDHSGGAASVLQAHPDATLIAPRGTRLVARRQRRCMAGVTWDWDGVRFAIAAPVPLAPPRSDNDNSCVLWVSAPGFSILLPGDIGRRREEALVTAGLIGAADVVVAPHHGSRTSSGSALVRATRPRLAVFSAGHRNRWGFPAPEIRRRWIQGGACILETATTGAIVLVSSDRGTPVIGRRERIDGAHLWSTGDRTGTVCPGVTGDESSAGVG